jgi:hypothetical protein
LGKDLFTSNTGLGLRIQKLFFTSGGGKYWTYNYAGAALYLCDCLGDVECLQDCLLNTLLHVANVDKSLSHENQHQDRMNCLSMYPQKTFVGSDISFTLGQCILFPETEDAAAESEKCLRRFERSDAMR